MIDVKNLTRSYGSHRGVTELNFNIAHGQIIGLLGPNGAGKSTTIRVLCGQLLPSSGTVTIDGKDVVRDSLALRQQIGYLPENAPLYKGMITQEYLLFVARLYGLNKEQGLKALERVAKDCDLLAILKRPLSQVSRGYRQRTALAAALIHQPKILILDEPTASLDPLQVIEVHHMIRRLAKNVTVIFSSHILSEVDQLCERLLILNQGQLIADSPPETLRQGNYVLVEVAAPATATKKILKGFGHIRVTLSEDNFCRLNIEGDRSVQRCQEINKTLHQANLIAHKIQPGVNSLEEVFASLTQKVPS